MTPLSMPARHAPGSGKAPRLRVAARLAAAVLASILAMSAVQYAINGLLFSVVPDLRDAPTFLDLIAYSVPTVAMWWLLMFLGFRCVPASASRLDRIGPAWIARWVALIGAGSLLHALGVSLSSLAYYELFSPDAMGRMRALLNLDSGWKILAMEFSRTLSHSIWIAILSAAVFLVAAHRRESERQRIRNAELSLHLARARMEALSARLNPHFLFNALHTVSALVHAHPDRAIGGIARLGEVLRIALDRSERPFVLLCEEVEFAEDYLAIEHLRFGERLHCEWRIDAATAGLPVPPFLIQPLVENAVKYGVERCDGPTRIRIAARIQQSHLLLEVSHRSQGEADDRDARAGLSMGIRNFGDRMDALYGQGAWLIQQRFEPGASETLLLIPLADSEDIAQPTLRDSAPDADGDIF